MTAIQKWFASLVGTTVIVMVSYEWLDRPIALWARREFVENKTYSELTHIPDPLIPVAVIIFVLVGLYVLSRLPLQKLLSTALLCSISVIVAETIKNWLKYAFGRTWPDTWIDNNPSFLHDGVYGFNFFHGGQGYASFPSGHTTVTCAVISVLWMAYPKLWPLYVLAVLAVVIGLIGADYHFFSDIIAGGFLGTTVGWMLIAMWQTRQDVAARH